MNDAATIPVPENNGGEVGLVEWKDYHHTLPFEFDDGSVLPELNIRYETYGRLNDDRSNAILVCHALTGDHHCAGIYSMRDRKPGWWNNLIGPGKAIDTNTFFVVCSNVLGSCYGSTGPPSINPKTGEPYGLDFPWVTVGDMVRAQKLLVDHLEIPKLFCVTGGSMGGMQVLQWAIAYPGAVARILPMATTARQGAQAIAFNEVGRSAIVQDPAWKSGRYDSDEGPRVGLAIARMMAHITYLSDKGMDEKFGRTRRSDGNSKSLFDVEFEVESYLRYQGETFVNRFDANSYLYLTKALDRFDLYGPTGDLEDALKNVEARTLAIGFDSDWLFPPQQNKAIVHALLRCGKDATYAEISMDHGHDSFLVQAPELFELVSAYLEN